MKADDRRDTTHFFPQLNVADVPAGVDRGAFFMGAAMVGSSAVMDVCSASEQEQKVAAAPPPQAHDQPNQVVANAAESALQHHPGFMIASNEIAANRRVDFDTSVAAMALTAKER